MTIMTYAGRLTYIAAIYFWQNALPLPLGWVVRDGFKTQPPVDRTEPPVNQRLGFEAAPKIDFAKMTKKDDSTIN